jgi:hypothetical protein
VNTVEDRLRDAVQAAARTVTPAALQDLEQRIARRAGTTPGPVLRRERKRGRIVLPLAAAVVVTAIAVLAAVLAPQPRAPRQRQFSGLGPASAATSQFLIGDDGNDSSNLYVFSRAAGRTVATFQTPLLPGRRAGSTQRTVVGPIATGNGRTFLVDVDNGPTLWAGTGTGQVLHCESWLYQFTLSATGQPSALTPFAAMPKVRGDIFQLAVSGNGRQIAYTMAPCLSSRHPHAVYMGTTSAVTGQTRKWVMTEVNNVSLSADGTLLLYNSDPAGNGSTGPEELRVIPVNAPPGSLAQRSRTLINAAVLGRGDSFSFFGLSPDGRTAYFSVMSPVTGRSEIGSISLPAGRPRIIAGGVQVPGVIIGDPQLRHLLFWQGSRLVMLDLRTSRVTPLRSGLRRFLNSFESSTTW